MVGKGEGRGEILGEGTAGICERKLLFKAWLFPELADPGSTINPLLSLAPECGSLT